MGADILTGDVVLIIFLHIVQRFGDQGTFFRRRAIFRLFAEENGEDIIKIGEHLKGRIRFAFLHRFKDPGKIADEVPALCFENGRFGGKPCPL